MRSRHQSQHPGRCAASPPAIPHTAPRRLAQALALALAALASNAAADTLTAGTEAELVQAINDANAAAGADTIDVTGDITLSAALPTITDALTIEGSGGQRAIRRDDSGDNACSWTATNAFRLIDASADLTLSDLALSGGCNLVDQGGAVRVQGANLQLQRSLVSGNAVYVENADYEFGQGIGGGVAVLYGNATVSDSTISGNSSNGLKATGGGIALFYGSALDIERSTISGNLTTGLWGGGVYASGDLGATMPSTVTIADSTIADNRIDNRYHYDYGGGYQYNPIGGGLNVYFAQAVISGSRFTGNQVTAPAEGNFQPRGGAISIYNYASAITHSTIDRTVISGNSISGAAYGFGGAMRVTNSPLTMTGSTVAGNSVDAASKGRAGGLMIESGVVDIVDSTISGNRVSANVNEGGGAIMLLSEHATPTVLLLLNSTITGNQSLNSDSGGIYIKRQSDDSIQSTVLIESSILSGNEGQGGLADIGVATSEAVTAPGIVAVHAMIEGSVAVGAGSFETDDVTDALRGFDPQLLPLADNGGPTPTHALASSSPAIDQGTNPLSLAFDQRGNGFAREAGATNDPPPDIGAYEYDADRIFADGFDP